MSRIAERRRLRPSAGPLGLFAARGRAADQEAGRARRGRPHAGARHRRHRQSLRRARVLREDGREGHPADRRLPGRPRFRRHAPRPAGRARRAQKPLADIVLIAASEAGYWNLVRLVSRSFMETEPGERAHIGVDCARRRDRRADRADRRAGRPDRPRDRGRAERPRRGAARPARAALSATGSMSSCSATALRSRGGGRAASRRLAYRRGLPLVATNEPFFPARDDYEAHDALIAIAEGAVIADDKRRRLTAGALFQDRAPRWRRCSPTCPRRLDNTVEIAHARAPAGRGRAKPILPRFAGADGRRRRRPRRPRRSCCARGRATGLDRAARRPRHRAGPDRARTTTSGSSSSSASSSG